MLLCFIEPVVGVSSLGVRDPNLTKDAAKPMVTDEKIFSDAKSRAAMKTKAVNITDQGACNKVHRQWRS